MTLKDKKHPYYCSEGNYYSNDCYQRFDSFDDFLEGWADCDIDYNRIHRWDISEGDDEYPAEVSFYYILQRTAIARSCHFPYDPADDDRIREFLRPHKEYNDLLWDID